jgi:hypothetical protein
MAKLKNTEENPKILPLKSFREELETLLSQYNDSILASYIGNCLREYDQNNVQQSENPFGVDLTKMPEVLPNNPPQPPQPIPANVGNNVSTGWSNPFGGTSWGT